MGALSPGVQGWTIIAAVVGVLMVGLVLGIGKVMTDVLAREYESGRFGEDTTEEGDDDGQDQRDREEAAAG